MASVIVDAAPATADGGGSLGIEWIPVVDIRLLSQSELYSLSLCSSTAADPRRFDDIVVPTIDRSVFNESAGSRKQTYSRLRLAPASSSPTSAGSRRRTPHLRHASSTSFADVNSSDPENAENAQIVSLLKQMLSSRDVDPGVLFTVKIDYSIEGCAGHKRKRGRPCATGNLDSAMVANANDVDEFSSLSEIIVREEREGEVLNADGVVVDLAALGTIEHPYHEEMRRRTHGLGTEEELLGFLKELSGQWGSRRKKKRIVDASEFGTALPVGWKLLLSVKKKNGLAWLYCRRYISPSGLQFVSCKEVSSYLLSLQGGQDTGVLNSANSDGEKLTSCAISDTAIHDDGGKDNPTSYVPPPAFGSTSSNREIQVEIGDRVSLQGIVEDILHCNKCNMNFKEKDELLQHESYVHSGNRYKNPVRITDGVIIKDGKYECQFCHKTFSERRRYNGHVGAAHVRYQAKTAGEPPPDAVDPSSFGSSQVRVTMMEDSLESDKAGQIHNAVIRNNALDMCSPCNKKDGHAVEYKANGNIRATNGYWSDDLVSKANTCSDAEVILSSNKDKSFQEHVLVNLKAAGSIDDTSSFPVNSGNFSLPVCDRTHEAVIGDMIKDFACIEKPQQCMLGECSLPDSNYHVEKSDNIDQNCQTKDELKVDHEDFADNGSVFESFGSHGDHEDKDIIISSQQRSDFEYLTCDGNIGNISTSGPMASILSLDPKISTLTMTDEKACVSDNVPHLIGKFSVEEALSLGKCQNGSFIDCNDDNSSPNEVPHESSSVVWPCDKQEDVSRKKETDALASLLIEPGPKSTSTSTFVGLSGQEYLYGHQNDKDEACERKGLSPKYDNLPNFLDGESSDPFSRRCAGLISNSVTRSEQDKGIGGCSAFTSATDEQFFTEDRMTRIFNDSSYEHNKEISKGTLLGGSGVFEGSNEAYALDKIYDAAPSSLSKLNDTEATGKNELSLSFVNLQAEPCREYNQVEIYQADGLKFQPVMDRTFEHDYVKQASPFEIGLPTSCFDYRTNELHSSLDVPNPGGDWNGTRGGTIGISGQDFMNDFDSSNSQLGVYVKADGSSAPPLARVVQGAACPQIPSSSYFNPCDLISDKGKEDLFSLNNYDIHSNMSRPAGLSPVEYSFMGEQNNSSSLPVESKIFSSNAEEVKKGLDPGFWLGKDALTSNASNTNPFTMMCVWCRNVFVQDAHRDGKQTGMCPSCSSRIPANGL